MVTVRLETHLIYTAHEQLTCKLVNGACGRKNGGIKKVDFQDFQILLSTVSWGVGGSPGKLVQLVL